MLGARAAVGFERDAAVQRVGCQHTESASNWAVLSIYFTDGTKYPGVEQKKGALSRTKTTEVKFC